VQKRRVPTKSTKGSVGVGGWTQEEAE